MDNTNHNNQLKKYLLPGLILLITAVLLLVFLGRSPDAPSGGDTRPAASTPAVTQNAEAPTGESHSGDAPIEQTQPGEETRPQDGGAEDPDPEQTEPGDHTGGAEDPIQPTVTPDEPLVLDHGLKIELIGTYSGMYVEDGSGEIVSDIMMVVLRNGAEEDLQLARIELVVDGETYRFQCTNLPAGKSVVLLELDRKTAVEAVPEQAEITLSTFFDSPMDCCEDVLSIEGGKNSLTVTNISGGDITGDIYVYYKFYEPDYFYGGITFRVPIRGGLPAGESAAVTAGHYAPDGCEIVQVTYGQ